MEREQEKQRDTNRNEERNAKQGERYQFEDYKAKQAIQAQQDSNRALGFKIR